jgi:hypothetical protein
MYKGSVPLVNFSALNSDAHALPPITKKPRARPKKKRLRSKVEENSNHA